MKRILCIALVAVMLVSLVACGGKLSGTYKTEDILGSYVSYTFKGSKVIVETYVLGTKALKVTGSYKIDGNEITLTYDSKDAEGEKNVVSGTQTFEKGDGYIKIGVLKLNAAK